MILAWGRHGDPPFDAVLDALQRLGADVFVADQTLGLSYNARVDARGSIDGEVETGTDRLALHDVDAAYLRPSDDSGHTDAEQVATATALLHWSDLTDAAVVNRPEAMAANNSKPYQANLIARNGFRVPPTLITTDPTAAHEFARIHGEVVYKSVSGVRSIVSRLRDSSIDALSDVVTCPTQFQAYIPGNDVRVHVVRETCIATAVESAADDYRYATHTGAETTLTAIELGDELAARCVDLVAALGLIVGGVDLRRAPDGEWHCFEVNPSPAFTYYEAATGQPIAATIAASLAHSRR